MPKHTDPFLTELREAALDAEATYLARRSDTSDAAEELTFANDAFRRYGEACLDRGVTPNFQDD